MKLSAAEVLSRLNASYWFIPLLVGLSGAAAAVLLLSLDARLELASTGIAGTLTPSSAEGARALLSAIISSMITAVSVTFSVTIVALTVAAQHFGPRVMNNFVRHRAAQVVLGTFIATFIYAVLVLGAVGAGEERLPRLAVSGAVVLVLLSVGALIFYVHHVSTVLQVGELTAAISSDLTTGIRRGTPPDAHSQRSVAPPPADPATILAVESGYVQRIDYGSIAAAAAERNAFVWIRREPGAFALAGAPLAVVEPKDACDAALSHVVQKACIVGRDRTLWHDPEFAVKQLVEVALRALSPGVNEPFTAVTCIDHLADGLAASLRAPRPRGWWTDENGVERVFAEAQAFDTLLRAAFDPIRIFADRNPAIYVRLAEMIGELGLIATRTEDRQALREQLDRLRLAAGETFRAAYDKAYVDARVAHAVQQLEDGVSVSRR